MDGEGENQRVSVMSVEETEIINQILSKHNASASVSMCHPKIKVINDDFEFQDDLSNLNDSLSATALSQQTPRAQSARPLTEGLNDKQDKATGKVESFWLKGSRRLIGRFKKTVKKDKKVNNRELAKK